MPLRISIEAVSHTRQWLLGHWKRTGSIKPIPTSTIGMLQLVTGMYRDALTRVAVTRSQASRQSPYSNALVVMSSLFLDTDLPGVDASLQLKLCQILPTDR